GSEWAWTTHRHLGGVPPRADLAAEQSLAEVLRRAAAVGRLSSAHDLSDGGLAQTLCESTLRGGLGARLRLPAKTDPFVALFSESSARALVTVTREHEAALLALCDEQGVPWTVLGNVDAEADGLEFEDLFRVGRAELDEAWTKTLPALFG
ncbi:MAG: AIR synthase-related protein, partial [Stackebrandtia sp.]